VKPATRFENSKAKDSLSKGRGTVNEPRKIIQNLNFTRRNQNLVKPDRSGAFDGHQLRLNKKGARK